MCGELLLTRVWQSANFIPRPDTITLDVAEAGLGVDLEIDFGGLVSLLELTGVIS